MRYIVNPETVVTPATISLDTEYDRKDVRNAKLLSISIGVSPELTYIFQRDDWRVMLDSAYPVRRLIENANIIFTWNGVVDWLCILNNTGYIVSKDKIVDAMLLEHLVNENLDHGLGDFALREFGDNYKKEFWDEYETYQEAPKEVQYEYETRDGCYTFIAGQKYIAALQDRTCLIEHVHRLQWSLCNTEIGGIKVDVDLIRNTKDSMSTKIGEYLPRLREEFRENCDVWELQKWKEELGKRKTDSGKRGVRRPKFSFSSDKQVSWLLYSSLGIEPTNKTKKGNPSTDYETIKALGESRPELKTLVEYKDTKAIYSTFVEGMLDRVENDRIYPHFNVNGTSTGRISHSNPNMGNLPTTGVIRNFFIPDDGNVLLGVDYSQLEVVIEANLTEDKSLLKIILEGASKHDITAQGLGISREAAKTLNFALQYGAGIHKVSKILSLSYSDAEDIFKRYWELYSGVAALKDVVCKQLAETGKVTNLFGRTRNFQAPRNDFERAKQQRQAYNFMIQGVGADMTNMATYTVANQLSAIGLGRLWFSVHDEVVCEIRSGCIDHAKKVISDSMDVPNNYLNLKYPVDNKMYGPLKFWSKE